MLKLAFLLLFCVGALQTAYAQQVGTEHKEQKVPRILQLDQILVEADKIQSEMDQPNMSIVIPELLLQGPGSTLDSALKRQPGIDVQRPQEVGAALDDESIRIRGFGSRRIQLRVDGRPLNAPGTAGGYFIDWTTVPLTNVETVEVFKGVTDPRYGNTLGGAINLVTKKPTTKPEVEAQASAGSFNTKLVNAFHSWKPGRFEYSISGSYADSNGYLWNGYYWLKNASTYLGYDLPWDGKVRADLQYVEVKKGFIVSNRQSKDYDSPLYDVPRNHRYPASDGEIMYGGMGATAEPGSWWQKEKFLLNLGYDQKFGHGLLNLNYWWNWGNREAMNTRASLNREFHKMFFDDRSYGWNGGYQHDFGSQTLIGGFDYARLKDGGDKNLSGDYRADFRNGNYVNSQNVGLYLMDEISLLEKKMLLTPGLRYMRYDARAGSAGQNEGIPNISEEGVAPSLRLSYNFGSWGIGYISAASALRMPTPPEHYWHYSPDAGVNTSNLSFNKEQGLMLQAGWKATLPTKTSIEIAPYWYRIKDYIQFDLINFVSYNIDRATIYGLEVEVAQQLPHGFSVFANYTFQKSTTSGDPFVANFVNPADRDFDRIPGLPEHKVNTGARYKGKHGEKIALYATYVSSQKVIYNNNTLYNTDLRVRSQSAYAKVDLEASYPITKHVELTGFIYNLLDEHYQERFGYQAAERNFGLGVKARF